MIALITLAAAGLLSRTAVPDQAADHAGPSIKSDLHLKRYKAASVDLNEDGVPEVLVYANGAQDCGSGGCNLYVLAKKPAGYRIVTNISVMHLPVRIMPSSSHGWRDLGVQVAGGGITREYEARLGFNGTTYPNNPTVAPAQPLSKVVGRIVLQ